MSARLERTSTKQHVFRPSRIRIAILGASVAIIGLLSAVPFFLRAAANSADILTTSNGAFESAIQSGEANRSAISQANRSQDFLATRSVTNSAKALAKNSKQQTTEVLVGTRAPHNLTESALADTRDSDGLSPSSLGTLMLCGGGRLPGMIRDRFFQLAGAEQGTLVVIPTASRFSDRQEFTAHLNEWNKYAWKQINVLHVSTAEQANAPEMWELLDKATAVWIAGGDQNRLADRYLNTETERKIKQVVRRGGVVGGTSAGTAIASKVMIGGGVNFPVLRSGFDLLPNTIVDQHFSQRNRFSRLRSAVVHNPERVGVGIDEGTALLVGPQNVEVIGNGNVFVYKAERIETESAVSEVPLVIPAGHFMDGRLCPIALE